MGNAAAAREVRLILDSDDFSTAAPFIMYDAATGAAITFVAGMVLSVYLVSISNGATSITVTVFDDADADGTVDAGEQLFEKILAINEQAGFALVRGFSLPRLPKAKASASSTGAIVIIYAELNYSHPVITPRVS